MKEMTVRELQLFCLDILKDVHAFCVKNDIKYTLAYGTLLGAVRHKGFIPWDNDVDICMLRSDYERFINSYKSDKYEIAYFSKKCQYDCLIAYARVFDKRKTIAKNSSWMDSEVGVWIDVFPMDVVPQDKQNFEMIYRKLYECWKRIQYKRIQFNYLKNQNSLNKKIRLLIHKIISLNGLRGHALQQSYIEMIKKNANGEDVYVSQLAVMDNGPVEHFPISVYENVTKVDFEDQAFYAVSDYDLLLKSVYGNYMELPPLEKQVPHQDYIKFFWR